MSRPDPAAAASPDRLTAGTDTEFPPPDFRRYDFFWAAGLAILALAPAVPFLVRHETILGLSAVINSENLNEWMIYRRFFNDTISQGILPAWTPQLFAGMPFIGWPHTSAFAPLGIIYYLLPYNTAAVAGLFVHAMIFGVSMYLLMRSLSFKPLAAWCAAFLAMNFFIVSQVEHYLPRFFTFSWSPLLIVFYVGIWRTGRFRYFMGAAVVLALQILGGKFEIIGRQFLALALVGIAFSVLTPRKVWLKKREIMLMGCSAVIGTLPSLCQLLPALEFIHFSTRSGREWFSYKLYSASATLIPTFLSSYGTTCLNVFTIAAAMVCVLELRKSLLIRVLALAALANLAIASNLFGVLKLLYRIPILGSMMWHQLSLLYILMMAIIMAGKTLDHVIRRPAARHLFVLSFSFALFGIFVINKSTLIHPDNSLTSTVRIATMVRAIGFAYLGFAAIGFSLPLFKARGPALGAALLLISLFLSYYINSFVSLHHEPDTFPSWNPSYVDFFSGRKPPYRSLNIISNDTRFKPSIPYQVGFLRGTEAIDAYISSPVVWYAEFFQLLLKNARPHAYTEDAGALFWAVKNEYFVTPKNQHLLDLLNLEYITTEGVNIKLASHYFLGYEFDPAPCAGPGCSVAGPPEPYGHPGIALSAPSLWRQIVYAQPRSELRLTLRAKTGGHEARPLFFQAVAEEEAESGHRIVYARALDPARKPAARVVNAVLASAKGQAVELRLGALPLSGPAEQGAGGLELEDPLIYNPDAYFQREPVEGVDIFRNPGALPRAFITHRARVIADKSERLAYIGGERFDPSAEVVLDESFGAALKFSGHEHKEPVKVVEYGPGRIVLLADAVEDAFLVVSDMYFPGWRAAVGGREERVWRADHAFQAVRLARGPHQVTLTYFPVSVRIGIFAALTAAMMMLGAAVMRFFFGG